MFKYVLLWFPMLLLAIANGALRDLVYKKYTGDLAAHQISTLLLIILFAVYIGTIMRYSPPASPIHAISIGGLWLTLTLLFEFGFGRLRGNSWSHLFADYNLFAGRVWILVPLWLAIAPYIFYKFKGHITF